VSYRLALPALMLALPALGQTVLPDTVVRAQRLDATRNEISPSLGASVTTLDRRTIEGLPQGPNASLNSLLFQTPGAAVDSFGEIHLRGEHRGLQYRLNGITLPEGVAGFGSFLDARAIERLSVLTGALPAQFGYRTGGVVDLTLRSAAQGESGRASLYGGSRGTINPSFDYAQTVGPWDFFVTGSYLRSNQGIENPTRTRSPIHNDTEQYRGLAYISRALDDRTRLSFITGSSWNRFQIPNSAAQVPDFTAFGVSNFDSRLLRSRQTEVNHFNVLALQTRLGALDLQVAAFHRTARTSFTPDTLGDLLFNGVASQVQRRSDALGLQADAVYRLNERHTLRFGASLIGDRTQAINRSTVLPLDADGAVLDAPFRVEDRTSRTGFTYGLYAQDEWRIADRLTLNLGLRFDYLDAYVQAGQVSPRANLVWLPFDGTRVSLGYARYFTPPAQDLITPGRLSLFSGTTAAPLNTRSDPVRPERSHYFNLGIQQRITPVLTVGVNGYYKDARDLTDLGQFGRAIVFTPFNYRRGQVYGVEFTTAYRSARFDAYANLAVSRAAGQGIRSGQFNFGQEELDYIASKRVRLDHDQLITASAGVIYRPWEGGRASGTMLAGTGLRRGFANTERQAPYSTFNLGLAQDWGPWTARLDVINLADRVVQLRDGSGIGVGAPQFLARRGVYAGLSRAF
jgi:outer membrane receptor protein involved in Fe transport